MSYKLSENSYTSNIYLYSSYFVQFTENHAKCTLGKTITVSSRENSDSLLEETLAFIRLTMEKVT